MVSFGFGGGGGSTVQRFDAWNPQQKALFRKIAPIIERGLAGPVPAYPGQMYVPRLPEEQQAIQFLGTGQLEQMPYREAALRSVLSGTVPYEVGPEYAKEFFHTAIKPQMMHEFREEVLPQIRESYVGPGFYGSARAEAETKAAENLARNLGSMYGTLMYQEELARRQAIENALQRQAGAALGAYEMGVKGLGTAGEWARMIEQERVLAGLQRWLMGESIGGVTPTQYNPFLQLAFQALGLQPYVFAGTQHPSYGFQFGFKF